MNAEEGVVKIEQGLPFNDRLPLRDWVAHGYRCAIYIHPTLGGINGYVRVPSLREGITDQVEVHGGVTFEGTEWIGFDTMHAGDHWEGCWLNLGRGPSEGDRVWTEELVVAETERMAALVKELMEQ